MSGFQLPFGIQPVNPVAVDYWSGPYTATTLSGAITAANAAIPSGVRFQSMEVRLLVGSSSPYTPYKYWYSTGITDSDLQPFVSGNISGTGSAGQVTYWSGTSGITGSSSLMWDNSSKLLTLNSITIGTVGSPSSYLNTIIGYNINTSFTGLCNTLIGGQVAQSLTTGSYNTIVGAQAGPDVTTGGCNTIFGQNAGGYLSTGTHNTFIGYQAGATIESGSNNTIIGGYLGYTLSTSNSVIISDGAGNIRYQHDGSNHYLKSVTSGTYSNILYYDTSAGTVKYGAVTSSQWTNLVSPTTTIYYSSGNVLIGTSSDASTGVLQVTGTVAVTGNITASGTITATAGGYDSDITLKSNIIYNPKIEKINEIKATSYTIRNEFHYGYIAQDIEKIIPSAIIKKDDGLLAVQYHEVLVAKVQYLENTVDELRSILSKNNLI